MTLRELSQLYHLMREIEQDRERLARLKAMAADPSGKRFAGVPGSGDNASRLERYVVEMLDLEAIIAAKVTQCVRERGRLERYIMEIPESYVRQIFTLRFVEGLTWARVAEKVGGNTEDSVKKICYRYLDAEK